jgi:hypothetical protein
LVDNASHQMNTVQQTIFSAVWVPVCFTTWTQILPPYIRLLWNV